MGLTHFGGSSGEYVARERVCMTMEGFGSHKAGGKMMFICQEREFVLVCDRGYFIYLKVWSHMIGIFQETEFEWV